MVFVGVFAVAIVANAATIFSQGFETDTVDWQDGSNGWYGTITRTSSGTNGITSSEGSYHAIFEGDEDSGPFSRFGEYRDTWTGDWYAEIDVYLDPEWTNDEGFDYSVASSKSDGSHLRDFIFHVGTVEDYADIVGKKLLVNGSNNTDFQTNPYKLVNDNGGDYYVVEDAGWYTLQHHFYDNGGVLAVDLNLIDSEGTVLWTATRSNAADLIPSVVGGNRYAWFTHIDVTGGIAVDEHKLYDTTAFVRSAEITSPEEDEVISGDVELAATYDDEDGNDNVAWAVRFETCAANDAANVAGNVGGFSTPYDWDGAEFYSQIDTTSWDDGKYCFIFNPLDDPDEENLRETRWFYVDNDADDDGIQDGADKCPATEPDGFPEWGSKKAKNHWMFDGGAWLVNGDKEKTQGDFDPTIEDTYGCSGMQILDAMSEVTGEDFGGQYKFGLTKGTIEDWMSGMYHVGPTFVETVEVPANSDTPTESTVVLESGNDYSLKAHGTAYACNQSGCVIEFDAEYSTSDATDWVDGVAAPYDTEGVDLLDLMVDGSYVDWGSYNPSHEYEIPMTGTGSTLSLLINDIHYPSNSGSIFVDITEDKWISLW